MGFVLSVLYLVTYYLSPVTVFGPLATFHIELILAVLVIGISLPKLIQSSILKTPQSLALLGLALAVFLSILIGMHWFGRAAYSILIFIPNAFPYFLVCLHCDTRKKLKVLVAMLLFVCLFVIVRGCIDLHRGVPAGTSIQTAVMGTTYVIPQINDAGETIYRLRGMGEINDPNDFGQLLVCVIPLLLIFWRTKKMGSNIVMVVLPICALLCGIFFTHSRGALLALIAVLLVAARRRIGTLPSLLIAVVVYIAAMALHFTGGRDISTESGYDRLGLWGSGLELLKSHPLFGVGYGNLADFLGLTAHNSVVVCAAELGGFGLFFWCLFLFPTVRDTLVVASANQVGEGEPIVAEDGMFPQEARKIESLDKAEINRLGRLMLLSLTGFLVAGWFLSRAFVVTLFMLGGMAEVVFQMALDRGMIASRMRFARVLPYAGILAVALVMMMYILLRVTNLTR